MLAALFNPASLDSCIESNHTCRVWGVDPHVNLYDIDELENAKAMKVFTVLSATATDGFFDTSLYCAV